MCWVVCPRRPWETWSVMSPRPAHVPDVSVGAWIRERLDPATRGVGSEIPSGFDAYARFQDPDARFVPPYEAVTAPPGDNGLSTTVLRVLCELIPRHAGVSGCYFGVWEGHGWTRSGSITSLAGRPITYVEREAAPAEAKRAAFPDSVLKGPKLDLPIDRVYFLFEGPLGSVFDVGRTTFGRWEPHSPDLIWPKDQQWFISTDVDFWFACIGGPKRLVEAVVGDHRLSSKALTAEDPLIESDEWN